MITKYLSLSIIFTAIGCALLCPAYSEDNKPVQLLTEEEARDLKFSDSQWDKEHTEVHTNNKDLAPSILIRDPKVVEHKKGPTIIMITPANVLVLFEENSSKLDLTTLQIWAEKFYFKKNITSRVMKYVTTDENGAQLKVNSVNIPSGKYKIGIKISDIDGNEIVQKYRLKVN